MERRAAARATKASERMAVGNPEDFVSLLNMAGRVYCQWKGLCRGRPLDLLTDVYDSSDSDTAHDDPQSKCSLLVKPHTNERQTGYIQESRSETHAHALRQEHLPVSSREREHHDAQDDEEVADDEHGAKVSQIK